MSRSAVTQAERSGVSAGAVYAAAGLCAVGACAAIVGLALRQTAATWQALLVGFLYWNGLAQGMVVWAAIFRTTRATWSSAVSRVGQSAVAFLPASLLLYVVLLVGREHWLVWIHHPVPEKSAWLSVPFYFGRGFAALALTTALSLAFVAAQQRAEWRAHDRNPGGSPNGEGTATALSVALCIAYMVVYGLVAFDMVMSLSPHCYSTMMAPYYAIGNLYAAMAALIIASAAIRRQRGWQGLGAEQFQDLGNLLFGFGILAAGLLFAQLLTIWYGNIPEETEFLIRRLYEKPWQPLSWVVLIAGFVLPFVLLQSVRLKRNPRLLAVPAWLVLIGMWIERYVLVAPSITPKQAQVGPLQLLAGVGLAGGFAMCLLWSLRHAPTAAAHAGAGEERV